MTRQQAEQIVESNSRIAELERTIAEQRAESRDDAATIAALRAQLAESEQSLQDARDYARRFPPLSKSQEGAIGELRAKYRHMTGRWPEE
jgi:ATP/maltotriose-dependent transcriptional regulator MalT